MQLPSPQKITKLDENTTTTNNICTYNHYFKQKLLIHLN